MIEKNWGPVDIYYKLQNNGATLFHYLSNKHNYLDLDFDKI